MRTLTLLFLFILTGCVPPLPPGDMMPMTSVYTDIPANAALDRSVRLGTVTVPQEAENSSIAPLKAEVFREAIQNALLTSNMSVRADSVEKFTLDAQMIELGIPMFGFSMDANSKVNYQLTRVKDGKVVFNEIVTMPYTAPFSEAFDGNQRSRIATSKAIRENITHMLRLLAQQSSKTLLQ